VILFPDWVVRIFVKIVNTIKAKSLPGLPKNLYLTPNSTAKMDLVKPADIAPIFGTGPIKKSNLSSLNTALGIIQRDESLFTSDTLTIANGA